MSVNKNFLQNILVSEGKNLQLNQIYTEVGIAIDETPIPYIYDSTIPVLKNRIFKSPCEETRKLMEESKTILNCNVSNFSLLLKVSFYRGGITLACVIWSLVNTH